MLIPIAMVIGYFIVAAEPAVHILNRQVEEITAGSIPASAMNLAPVHRRIRVPGLWL